MAVSLPQRPETAIAYLGIFKMGGISVSLSPLFGVETLRHCLTDSGAKILVTDSRNKDKISMVDKIPETLEHIMIVDGASGDELDFEEEIKKTSSGLQIVKTRAEDPAMIMYTSGTTGRPKGALHTHRFLIGRLPGFQMALDFFPQKGDLLWSPASWVWVAGLLDSLFAPWVFGVTVVAYNRWKFDPHGSYSLIERYGIRNAFLPPTALAIMMKEIPTPSKSYDINLRSVSSGGEPLPPALLKWAEKELDVKINELYGLTEASYLIGNCQRVMKVKPGSMGKPYPGHNIEILGKEGEILPSNQVGEIGIRKGDPVMFLGYWNNDETTAASFKGDFFLTGDLAYRDEEGYIWFVGRKDDVIISSGHRLGPFEIESCIMKHPAVEEVAAVAAPDEIRGNIVKVFVKLAPGYERSSEIAEEFKSVVKMEVAAFAYPRQIEFLDELPKSVTGKIMRKKLRERERKERTG